MKKLILPAALVLVAGASFAFLPKAEDAGSMMMVVKLTDLVTITTIQPDGTANLEKVELDRKSNLPFYIKAHQAELSRLNGLIKQGWHVTQQYTTFQPTMGGVHTEVTYMLDRR